jgi:Cu/Ag efflux pump CusA
MMRAIVGWALRYRGVVLGLAAAIVLGCALQLPNMPRDVVPEFSPPYVEIQTEALGLSADEVEQLITVPLEADLLHGVAFLDQIRSESVPGLSSIVLVFEPGTDIFRARQVVAERLTQAAALPNVSRPPLMLQPLSSSSRVLMVSLSSTDVSQIDMSVLARWTVRPRLLSIPGVANVAIWGQRERQMQVLVDPERLREQRISLTHVIETTGNALWVSPLTFLDASTPGAGGFIDTPNQRLSVQHIFPIRTPEQLAEVPIPPEDTGGRIVKLGDVATIVQDHQLLIGDALVNDGPGLLLVVEKFPDADTLEVTAGIEAALDAMRPGLTGISIDTTVFRPATYVEEAVRNLALALLVGFVLAVAAMLVYFRSWRSGLVAAVTIPVSVATAVLVLNLLGATLNAVLVAGLAAAIAIVVDDAISGADAVVRRLRSDDASEGAGSRPTAIIAATVARRGPLAYATLIVILALVPVFFLTDGPAGAFLPPLAVAYVVAVLAATAVALTVGPALAAIVFAGAPAREPEAAGRLASRVRSRYEALVTGVLRRTGPLLAGAAVVVVAVVVVAGMSIVSPAGGPLVESFREGDLLIHASGAPGTSRDEMNRIVSRAGAELRAIPGVRNVGAHVGRAITSDRVVGVDDGEFWISIDPAADYDATVAAVQDVIDGYPGLEHTVTTYSSDRIEAVLGETDQDVVVRVYGQELDILRAKAEEVRAALAGIDGLADVAIEPQIDQPTLQIQVDLAAAEKYGIKPGDVRRLATTLLSGIVVGSLFEDQKVFEVVVWGVPDLRHSLTSIRELLIDTPRGGQIRLGDVADVRVGASPTVIRREGVFRKVDVGAIISGGDSAAVMRDVESRLAAIEFPFEYRAEILPLASDRQAALLRVVGAVVVAVIGIFLLLQAAFGSWRRTLYLVLVLPAALAGAAIGALLVGESITLGTLAGFAAVLAFTVRAAVLTIDHCQRLEREGESFGADLVVRAAAERFGSVLASAVTIALAVSPFLILGDRPGLEILRPMAVVLIGGLASSTLLTLFVVPAVYLRSGPSPEPDAAVHLVEQPGLSPA